MDKLKQDRKNRTDHEVNMYLTETFEKEWPKWMDKIKGECVTKVEKICNMPVLVQDTLIEYYGNDTSKVIPKIQSNGRKSLGDWGESLKLEVEPSSDHFNFKQSFLSKILGKASPTESHLRVAKSVAEVACHHVSAYLRKQRNKNFHQSFITELLDIVNKVITNESKHQSDFNFTKDYKIVVSVTACGYALREFAKMVEEFDRQNDPIIYLETEVKAKLFRCFVNQYHNTAGEKVAACAIIDVLETSIELKVQRSLPSALYNDIFKEKLPYFGSKAALKRRILLDLGKGSVNLEKYFQYLSSPQSSLRYWIEVYTRDFCTRPSKIGHHADKLLQKEFESLKRKIEKMQTHSNSEAWLTELCNSCSLHVNIREFRDLKGNQKLEDVHHFEQEVLKGINDLQKRLQCTFQKFTAAELERKCGLPYNDLCKDLLGCKHECLFCGEECDNSYEYHIGEHECHVHRPQCLVGWRNSATHEMVVHICNASVGSDRMFQNSDTGGAYRYYKDYNRGDLYPKWNIPVKKGAKACGYWKWFVGNYYPQIVERFGDVEANEVPHGWKRMQWYEAEYSLKEDFSDT